MTFIPTDNTDFFAFFAIFRHPAHQGFTPLPGLYRLYEAFF